MLQPQWEANDQIWPNLDSFSVTLKGGRVNFCQAIRQDNNHVNT